MLLNPYMSIKELQKKQELLDKQGRKWEKVSAFTMSEILELYGEDILIPANKRNKVDFIATKVIDRLSA